MKRLAIMVLAIVVGCLLVLSVLLFLLQRHIVYHPHPYASSYKGLVPRGAVELTYQTSSGRQVAFYIPARSSPDRAPQHLWLLFNGNAALALDWVDFIKDIPDDRAGFLLIEYPGYGACAGKPSLNSIRESTEAAFESFAHHVETERARLEDNLNVVGYSIGTAAGLQFAARHPVKRVVLIAPFTSMLDMARRSVGSPLFHLLVDRYDNRARLAELLARAQPPTVHIFHGDVDEVVPFRMGAELAQRHPGVIAFHAIKGATHGSILDLAKRQILDAMTSPTLSKRD